MSVVYPRIEPTAVDIENVISKTNVALFDEVVKLRSQS
jgi:hypothetical protein